MPPPKQPRFIVDLGRFLGDWYRRCKTICVRRKLFLRRLAISSFERISEENAAYCARANGPDRTALPSTFTICISCWSIQTLNLKFPAGSASSFMRRGSACTTYVLRPSRCVLPLTSNEISRRGPAMATELIQRLPKVTTPMKGTGGGANSRGFQSFKPASSRFFCMAAARLSFVWPGLISSSRILCSTSSHFVRDSSSFSGSSLSPLFSGHCAQHAGGKGTSFISITSNASAL